MNASLAPHSGPSIRYQVLQPGGSCVSLLTHCPLLVRGGSGQLLPLVINFLSVAAPVKLICCLSKSSHALLPVHLPLIPVFSLLASWLASFVLLKESKSPLVKSMARSRGQQFCSCLHPVQPGVRSEVFLEATLQSTLLAVDQHWFRWFWWLHFLRRVGPVSSVRSSSTEQGDQRQTWTCQRLCRTPLVRGDAGRREETEQLLSNYSNPE